MSALTLSKLVSPPWYYEPRRAVNRSRCAGNWTGIRLRSLLLGLDYEAEAEDACPLLGETGLHRVFGPVRGTNQLGTRHFVGKLVWEEVGERAEGEWCFWVERIRGEERELGCEI